MGRVPASVLASLRLQPITKSYLVAGDGRQVTYSAFGMPVAITQTLRSIEIAYGPDRARFKRVDINETGTKTTRYIAGGGAVEIVSGGGQTVYKTHVGGQTVRKG